MEKDCIKSSKGFYDAKLSVRFLETMLLKNSVFHSRDFLSDYQICFVTRGNFEFVCNEKSHHLTNGDIFIAKPYEEFSIKGFAGDQPLVFVLISFNQTLYKNMRSDENFLRAFDNRKKGEMNVYKKIVLTNSLFIIASSPL